MRYILFVFGIVFQLSSFAGNPIKIGLFVNSNYARATITVVKGGFDVYADGRSIGQLSAGQTADISIASGDLSFIFQGKGNATNTKVQLRQNSLVEYKIQPAGAKANGRIYEDNLTAINAGGHLQLIAEIDVEKYVAGVIEAEGGGDHEAEYYRVQAIISRTYAWANLRRHEAEGFNLCDATHCQVYHGRPRHEPLTFLATQTTEDIVIVDDSIDLITAAFHSNCGGHTINAENVWSKHLPYCIGRPDTFCLVMPHSNWEKSMAAHQWTSYLQSKRYPIKTDDGATAMAYFPQDKQVYFVDSSFGIPLRTIREDLKLKSTYFTVHQDGEQVRFIGQGFGHGVGLCQEGAMRMAQLGYSYKDIIHFYYTQVHLVPRHLIWFFKED